jgi:lambda repressor-like predicted transcriptional regulator
MSSLPIFSSDLQRTIWVQGQLKLNRASFASIARDIGCSRVTVSNAMFRAADPQERAIAKQLGVTQRELFPERFDSRGNRLHAVKNSAPTPTHNVNNEQAA